MQGEQQAALAAQMAAMLLRFETRCERIEQRLHASTEHMPVRFEEQMGRWLDTASGQVERVSRNGLESSLADGRRSIRIIAAEADQTVGALQRSRRDLVPLLRWVWIGAGLSLALSLVALFGTYTMLHGHYASRYETLKALVPYMDAINKADVVPCGDDQLCARIDDKAPRLGDRKQYRLVAPRS